MIKHTIDISQRPARISLRRKQLVLKLDDNKERTFLCEDVGVLLLQHPAISLSAAALNALLQEGAVVLICGENHLPTGMLLPTTTHTELVPRMTAQLEAGRPAKKQVWKAIVEAKIRAQAQYLDQPFKRRLLHLASHVSSGDSGNAEAQAAKIYWPARFPSRYICNDRRDPASESFFNSALNYGYAIIRAAVARALVSAGLQPALGVFHHRRDNPFCLADDVMEPLRPLVDARVQRLLAKKSDIDTAGLNPSDRRDLLSLLTHVVEINGSHGPLLASLPRYIASFYRMLTKESDHLNAPTYCIEPPTHPS